MARCDILLVDDDDRLRTAAGKVLAAENYRVVSVASAGAALEALKQHPGTKLVVSDLKLPDLDGIELLKRIRTLLPEVEVVMITGHGSIEKAVEALQVGAYDFIQKPLDSRALLKTVGKAIEKQRLSSENRSLLRQVQQGRGLEALIGESPAMQAVKQLIRQVGPTDVSVLIQGESGTGKEIVADALRDLSERPDKPLVKISCAALPEGLLESELFGHERGAFTGAVAAKAGRFELADGGTLFLDEIAEMSPMLQAKLLRVLQDGRFQRIGSTREICADFRLISATLADLPEAIEDQRFRHDLYYRINAVQIALPPLRDRSEDIPLLADHFLRRFAAKMGKNPPKLASAAINQLLAHAWPGNVRELEHVIQRAVALSVGDMVTHFTFAPFAGGKAAVGAASPSQPAVSIPIGTTVAKATRMLVEATIEECGGNKLQASKLLGVAPRTMYRRFS